MLFSISAYDEVLRRKGRYDRRRGRGRGERESERTNMYYLVNGRSMRSNWRLKETLQYGQFSVVI